MAGLNKLDDKDREPVVPEQTAQIFYGIFIFVFVIGIIALSLQH